MSDWSSDVCSSDLRVIDAAQHDVGVRMGGVEVIDRKPVEPGAEVGLHLRHQPADIGFEVGILRAVLGCNNKAELMALDIAPLVERITVVRVEPGCISFARRTPGGDDQYVRK